MNCQFKYFTEFESLSVGGGTTNAPAGGAQPSGDGYAR
jgi:hypothetical protein